MEKKKLIWQDLMHIYNNTLIYKNILSKFFIFQFYFYNNVGETLTHKHLIIYYFCKSPFNNIKSNLINISEYNILHYSLSRWAVPSKEITTDLFSKITDFEIDKMLLPTFSFSFYTEPSTKRFCANISKTWYPRYLLYFNFSSSCVIRENFRNDRHPVEKNILQYISFLFYIYNPKNSITYLNKYYNLKYPINNLNINYEKKKNIFYKTKNLQLNIEKKFQSMRKQTYPWPIYILGPLPFFYLPFFFLFELTNYTELEYWPYIMPVILCIVVRHYHIFAYWRQNYIDSKRPYKLSNTRDDEIDTRQIPYFGFWRSFDYFAVAERNTEIIWKYDKNNINRYWPTKNWDYPF